LATVPAEVLAAAATLWCEVFPSPTGTVAGILERLQGLQARSDDDRIRDHRLHACRVDGRVAAVARSFVRVIAASDQRFPVLALAGVACDPRLRHRGLGSAVVRTAFARLTAEVPSSLFQTGVPAFYERLGAHCVGNDFVNSADADRVWWNPHVMIYPAAMPWPTGRIDLLGGGW
jgi:ribosomal protein S18 acetylase RimI-like enzyme